MLQDVRSYKDPMVRKLVRQERIKADTLDLFGEAPPEDLMSDYALDLEGQARNKTIQRKYANRARNINRAWNRTQLYLPEILTEPCLDVLELSTAHGAMLEVARHFGHNVMGTDYANMVWAKQGADMAQFRDLNDPSFDRKTDDNGRTIDRAQPDWPYRHITQSLDLPMTIFDGGEIPYPFEDNSYDVVMCFQAIEHYCHPDHWMALIDEYCRISRQTVFVLLNRLIPEFREIEDYRTAFHDFRRDMRSYDRNGFRCAGCFVHWDQALGFKLSAR